MRRFRRLSRVAGVAARVLIVTAAVAPALAAQGAQAANTRDQASGTGSGAASRLQPARTVLGTLVGTWRFGIWFAGNFDGAPDAAGTRTVRALFDDLRVEWTEALDHSPLEARGIVGYDPSSKRFFWSAVYSAGATPELLTGVLDDAQPSIYFRPISASPGGDQQPVPAATLAVLDRDHFTWVAADRTWRAVFTRQPGP